jgi:hypothetical protein
VQAEIHIREIAGAGLRFGARGFDRFADTAPEIEFVGKIERDDEIVVRASFGFAIEERRVLGLLGTANAGRDADALREIAPRRISASGSKR